MHTNRGDDVQIIGVAGRDDTSGYEEFVSGLGVDGFDHIIDADGEIWADLGVRTQPAFAFINDDGSIDIHIGSLGVGGLNERIDELLAS